MANKFLIVTIFCHILTVTSVTLQEDYYVFSLTVNYDHKEFVINFPMDKFIDFYRCLCKIGTASCSIYASPQRVTYIQETYFDQFHMQFNTYYNRYLCEHLERGNAIKCSKFQASQTNCSNTNNCWMYRIKDEANAACSFGHVGIVWVFNQEMNGSYVYGFLEIKQCQPGCVVVNPLDAVATESTPLNPSLATKMLFTSSSTITYKPTAGSNTSSADDTSKIFQNNDNGKTDIIIGVIVSLLITIAVIGAIFGVLLCRRRKGAFFAKSANKNPARTGSTPTLLQLQNIDPTYANDVHFQARTIATHENNFAYPEVDNNSTAESSDGMDYDPDFYEFYIEGNPSLETPMDYVNYNNNAADTCGYENSTKSGTVYLNARGTNRMTNSSYDARKKEEHEDALIYEDVDCSAFENMDSFSKDNRDIDDYAYSNVIETEHVIPFQVSIAADRIFDNTQPEILKSAKNHSPSMKHATPNPVSGYSKLKDEVVLIKDSYNILSDSVDGKHESASDYATISRTRSTDFQVNRSKHSTSDSRAFDPLHVINFSHSPKPQDKSSDTNISSNTDRELKTSCVTENKNRKEFDVLTAKPQEKHIFVKRHEYFELERDYDYAKK